MINLLLFTAECANPYFPASEIPEMLATVMPLVTRNTIIGMFPVFAFNSTIIDKRILELAGELYEEHILGAAGPAGEEGNAKWKDIEIWSETPRPTGIFSLARFAHACAPRDVLEGPCLHGFAPSTLRALAVLEQSLIMPELLERAYSGLEVVNETHRTTVLLTMLNAITCMLVSEKLWFGGQKHLGLLLELSLPGVDLNHPVRTSCLTTFIVAAIQHVRIGDLSMHTSALPAYDEEMMDVDGMDANFDLAPFPIGAELGTRSVGKRNTRLRVSQGLA
ncbi:hypothetical protein K438DRAFT_1972516 [Mycena galopus ATCC 62051]|nr:hypothetical protein K438DRAFT_1972516 [Mycena galopus ATCC 62051]